MRGQPSSTYHPPASPPRTQPEIEILPPGTLQLSSPSPSSPAATIGAAPSARTGPDDDVAAFTSQAGTGLLWLGLFVYSILALYFGWRFLRGRTYHLLIALSMALGSVGLFLRELHWLHLGWFHAALISLVLAFGVLGIFMVLYRETTLFSTKL